METTVDCGSSVPDITPTGDTENRNMEIWDQVSKTNPAVTREAKLSGHEVTSICAQSQRKRATEIFGPFGKGWCVEDESCEFMDIGDTKLCTYRAKLWYILGSERYEIPITAAIKVTYKANSGRQVIDDEYSKKVQTNAITKGLSTLGFNSDIFEGMFEDDKYVDIMSYNFAGDNEPIEPEADPPEGLEAYQNTIEAAAQKGMKAWLKAWKVDSEKIQVFKDYIAISTAGQKWGKRMRVIAEDADEAIAEAKRAAEAGEATPEDLEGMG